jgi:hypothetical protein
VMVFMFSGSKQGRQRWAPEEKGQIRRCARESCILPSGMQ